MKTAKRSDRLAVIAAALLLCLAACAAPSGNGAAKAEPVATTSAPAADPAPPPRDIAAAITESAAAKSMPGVVDTRCKTDADCTIKDVGNCCGAYPQCVNIDSPTFPDQVKAACAASGQMGVCGFPSISGCQCVSGKCAASNGPAPAQLD
jgi:hypothetical protein